MTEEKNNEDVAVEQQQEQAETVSSFKRKPTPMSELYTRFSNREIKDANYYRKYGREDEEPTSVELLALLYDAGSIVEVSTRLANCYDFSLIADFLFMVNLRNSKSF